MKGKNWQCLESGRTLVGKKEPFKKGYRTFILSDWVRVVSGSVRKRNVSKYLQHRGIQSRGVNAYSNKRKYSKSKHKGTSANCQVQAKLWARVRSLSLLPKQRDLGNHCQCHGSSAVSTLVMGRRGQIKPTVAKLDIIKAHMVSTTVGREDMHLFSLQNNVSASDQQNLKAGSGFEEGTVPRLFAPKPSGKAQERQKAFQGLADSTRPDREDRRMQRVQKYVTGECVDAECEVLAGHGVEHIQLVIGQPDLGLEIQIWKQEAKEVVGY